MIRALAGLWFLLMAGSLSGETFFTLSEPGLSAQVGTQEVLRNADVMAMVRAGLGDDIIVLKIRATVCEFDVSTNALAVLKAGGTSEAIVLAMIDRVGTRPASEPIARNTAPGGELATDVKDDARVMEFWVLHDTDAALHSGRLAVSDNRIAWDEGIENERFDQRKRRFSLTPPVTAGTPNDNFSVTCNQVVEVGASGWNSFDSIRLRNRRYGMRPVRENKENGRLELKGGGGGIPGLYEALLAACPGLR